ncbi:hypothetical protein ALC53_12889 [Atta colombica]|uniref:HAT C-terminal dimerisation domain-containing protein n=1 Tax=Atta colombica TaxID=520822 RepID=A0A151HYX4_9HYME|nr:hypothetical protein ALC53_12889 [Atta colombica]
MIHIDSLYTKQIMNTPIQEFETYRNTPRMSKECSVLNWLKQNEITYPTLSKVIKDIFGIIATTKSTRIILCINSWLTCSLKNKFQRKY